MLEEERDDVTIGRGVSKAEPALALGDHRCDQRKPWRHRSHLCVAQTIFSSPCPSEETGLVEPGLVHVDNALPGCEEAEESKRELLPLDQGPVRVGLRMHLLGFNEAELEVLLQYLPNEPGTDDFIVFCKKKLANLAAVGDGAALLEDGVSSVLDRLSIVLGLFSLLFQLTLLSWIGPRLAHQDAYKARRHAVATGYLLLWHCIFDVEVHYLLLFL